MKIKIAVTLIAYNLQKIKAQLWLGSWCEVIIMSPSKIQAPVRCDESILDVLLTANQTSRVQRKISIIRDSLQKGDLSG